jgi:hypothetical protein
MNRVAETSVKFDFNLEEQIFNKIKKIYESKNLTTPFEKALEIYNSTPCFKINENVYNVNPEWNDDVHYLMRLIATEGYYRIKWSRLRQCLC